MSKIFILTQFLKKPGSFNFYKNCSHSQKVYSCRFSISIHSNSEKCNSSGKELQNFGYDFETVFKTGKVPEYFNFCTDVFDSHVAQNPSKLALWVENDSISKQWSFSQLRAESVRAAISLQKILNPQNSTRLKNVKPHSSSVIFALLPKLPEWWFLYLASIRLGTIFCPATTQLSSSEISERLVSCQPSIIVCDEDNLWKIEEGYRKIPKNIPHPVGKIVIPKKRKRVEVLTAESWEQYDDLVEDISDSEILAFRNTNTKSADFSQIFFTSGTTGKSKMVGHVHSSYGIGHYYTTKVMGISSNDLYWNLSDPGWAKSSYGNFYAPWNIGAGVYIHQMDRFEVEKVLEILRTRPIDGFCAPPTFFKSLIQIDDPQKFKFKSLKYCVTGGEALSPQVNKIWKEKTGVSINPLYGQTEMTSSIGMFPNEVSKEFSMGKGQLGYEIKITDDAGKELPFGTVGNLAVRVKPSRPIGLFPGYLKRGENNGLEVDVDRSNEVGDFYLTGDLAKSDENGEFYYIGRADDVIITAGHRIGPFEVESVVQKHESVQESAVVASPDEHRGHVVKAFIILNPKYKERNREELAKEIQEFCKSNAAPYKYPRKIEFVNELPKTVSGKILRRELRKMEEDKSKFK